MSEKIFIGPVGAILTDIDVSIFNAEVSSFEPSNLEISDYLTDLIELAAFFTGTDELDTSLIENYSLGVFWEVHGEINRLTTNIQNLHDSTDPVNLLRLSSLPGIQMIPTGILNPIDEFNIDYCVNTSEPVLQIDKNFNITLFNYILYYKTPLA